MYVLHIKYRRSFSSMSQSSDELIIQVMAIARNKRFAERFLVLMWCGLLQRRRFFLSERSTYQWWWFPWNFLNSALYVTIEVELLKPFLIKLHYISENAFALFQICTAIFIVATNVVHERQNAIVSKWRHIESCKIWPPSQFFSGYALGFVNTFYLLK